MRTGIEGESDRTRQSLIVPSIRERSQTVPRTASPSADAHRRQNEARAHPWSPLRPGYVFSHSRQLQPAPGGPRIPRMEEGASGHVYGPRRPTTTPLYPVVQHHLETFLAQATEGDPMGCGVPCSRIRSGTV